MAIYRCNSCTLVEEVTAQDQQTIHHCGRCGKPVKVYPTVFFVEQVLQRYASALKQVHALTSSTEKIDAPQERTSTGHQIELDTTNLATPAQHKPLLEWFQTRKIQVKFQYDNVNINGYFDEAARQIAENYNLIFDLLRRIIWSYRKSHFNLNIELARMAQKDAIAIQNLCRDWYQGALFSKYFYQKNEKILRLGLQPALPAKQFFEGGWLEWLALDTVLDNLKHAKSNPISCARGVKITFANEDLHELDILALFGENIVCIECKTGEFRSEIDKLIRLKKRMNIPQNQFIILSSQLETDQTTGLSAMYGMTFVNIETLKPHIEKLVQSF